MAPWLTFSPLQPLSIFTLLVLAQQAFKLILLVQLLIQFPRVHSTVKLAMQQGFFKIKPRQVYERFHWQQPLSKLPPFVLFVVFLLAFIALEDAPFPRAHSFQWLFSWSHPLHRQSAAFSPTLLSVTSPLPISSLPRLAASPPLSSLL